MQTTRPVGAPRRRWGAIALATATALALAGCGGGGDKGAKGTATTTTSAATGEIAAQVASYEVVANRDQRFLTGLVVSGKGTVVSFGSVNVQFFYLGTRDAPVDPPQQKSATTAQFLPVAGQKLDPNQPGPRIVRPSEGLGVYEAKGVRFDSAGFWGARITTTLDGKAAKADTAFEVMAQPSLPAPGAPAPRTDNPTVATAGLNDPSLDSRASPGSPLPDPELHGTSIAAAIAAHKPVMVVISTPVYCVSKFCGPITDSVAALAAKYKDRAVFVHLEVWKDFEKKQINPAAGQWIQTPTGDAQEPWVFTIGRDGVILDRFDNVASDAELDAAVQRIIA